MSGEPCLHMFLFHSPQNTINEKYV